MPRTTSLAVSQIIEVDDAIDLAPFISVANIMVTRCCTGANAPADGAYDDEHLELIERWLSAHFYAVRDPRATDEKADVVGASYESKVDLGLAITRYGQQAMLIDVGGGLARANKIATTGNVYRKPTVSFVGNQPPVNYVTD